VYVSLFGRGFDSRRLHSLKTRPLYKKAGEFSVLELVSINLLFIFLFFDLLCNFIGVTAYFFVNTTY